MARHIAAWLGLLAIAAFSPLAQGATFTWSGAGGDNLMATGANWVGGTAPTATGQNLVFAGSTNLSVSNNVITSLATVGTALAFDSTAGAFTISGSAITMGSGGGGGQTIVQQNSVANQTISANISLSGGNGDRSIVFGAGAGTLTLSGNINFGTSNGDWLFPTTSAGTIILSGSNIGDGKATVAVTSGSNTMRAMMRNNVAGTQLVLGSDYALANAGSGDASLGTAALRGVLANQNLTISTTNGSRNLPGSSLAINASNITFNGSDNLAIGNILAVGGGRDFVVSNTGPVTVGTGFFLTTTQTGGQLYANLTGAGGMVVSGKIFDTFDSRGLTSGTSTLKKGGAGTLTLNGNSSSTFTGLVQVDAGVLKIGSAGALGGTAVGTTIASGATLDLNGQTIGESLSLSGTGVSGAGALVNTSASTASVTADIVNPGSFTIGGSGDTSLARVRSSGVFTMTKVGAGTVTTTGSSHNNLLALSLNGGTVVFANTSGFGADRGVTITSGTLRLSGANNNLINDAQSFMMNGGVFDLNGKAEAVAAIVGAGGSVRNGAAATIATVYVGGGVSGASSGTFAGVFENGSGVLNLVKEGTGIQTLTGTSTYTGTTGVNAGGLIVNGALGATSTTVAAGALLGGSGSIGGLVTVSGTLSPGNSPGVITLASLALNPTATTLIEITGTNRGLAYDGIDITTNGGLTYGGALAFDFSSLFTDNTTFDIFSFTGSSAGSFTSVVSTGSYAGTWTNNNNGTFSLAKDSQTLTFSQSTGDVIIVPEPTALILVAMGVVAWAATHRRRSTPALQRREG